MKKLVALLSLVVSLSLIYWMAPLNPSAVVIVATLSSLFVTSGIWLISLITKGKQDEQEKDNAGVCVYFRRGRDGLSRILNRKPKEQDVLDNEELDAGSDSSQDGAPRA